MWVQRWEAACTESWWVQMQVGIPTYTIGGFKRGWLSRCAQYHGADVRWVPKPACASTRCGVLGCAWGKQEP